MPVSKYLMAACFKRRTRDPFLFSSHALDFVDYVFLFGLPISPSGLFEFHDPSCFLCRFLCPVSIVSCPCHQERISFLSSKQNWVRDRHFSLSLWKLLYMIFTSSMFSFLYFLWTFIYKLVCLLSGFFSRSCIYPMLWCNIEVVNMFLMNRILYHLMSNKCALFFVLRLQRLQKGLDMLFRCLLRCSS